MRPLVRDSRGFTLAELLVAVAVLGLIMGALFTLQRQGQFAYLVGAARVEVQQNARVALDTMTSTIRLAQPAPGTTQALTAIPAVCATGPVPTGGGATSISFTIMDTQVVPEVARTVSYQLVGTDLQRTLDGVPDTLVGGVQQLRIWCYDGNGALNSTLVNIREIRIHIRTQTERGAQPGQPGDQHATLEARVRFRNL